MFRMSGAAMAPRSMSKNSLLLLGVLIGQVALVHPVIADEVPQFDIQKNCNLDVRAYGSGKSKEVCIADEQKAKVVQWSRFSADSKSRCMSMVTDISGAQSYVELLTCLQVAGYAPR
jgi:hypothetical protein